MTEPLLEVWCVLKRQAELERHCQRIGGVQLSQEHEFALIQHRLAHYPAATHAILTACERRRCDPDALSLRDVAECIGAVSID